MAERPCNGLQNRLTEFDSRPPLHGDYMKVFNTLTRNKEELKLDNKINLFVCGPTVYDYSHIGHARTYVSFDVIVKYLRAKGYDVFYLQNITDIDDKIINRAREEKKAPLDLSKEFADKYFGDMKILGVNSVSKYAFATQYIKEIISQVKRLIEKGAAYQIEDGIYFDLSKFPEYGKLSGTGAMEAEHAVSRIDESISKRNRGDFCLWKMSKVGEPFWKSPWGEGRPGWHIEDTAITEKEFGPQYDIHGGGRDLMFPHHEAEIAQMESVSGKEPMVRYWMHTGFLNVDGQKMSKSLGNFITIRDALQEHDPQTLRFFFLMTHYRSPINYTEDSLESAKSSLERISIFIDSLKEANGKGEVDFEDFKNKFEAAMEDDFNTPEALAVMFDFIKDVNKLISENKVSEDSASMILEEFMKINEIFGIIKKKEKAPKEIMKMIEEREEYRKKKDFIKSDEIRNKIKKKGWIVEDTDSGPKIRKD